MTSNERKFLTESGENLLASPKPSKPRSSPILFEDDLTFAFEDLPIDNDNDMDTWQDKTNSSRTLNFSERASTGGLNGTYDELGRRNTFGEAQSEIETIFLQNFENSRDTLYEEVFELETECSKFLSNFESARVNNSMATPIPMTECNTEEIWIFSPPERSCNPFTPHDTLSNLKPFSSAKHLVPPEDGLLVGTA